MSPKDQEAVKLAGMHYEIDEGLTQVFRIRGPGGAETRPDEPIKLLEVNEATVASGIMPIQFGPSPGVGLNHSSIIIEVTPGEFQRIQDRHLELPHGWSVGEPIPRPVPAEAG
jgi:hypothetical protein